MLPIPEPSVMIMRTLPTGAVVYLNGLPVRVAEPVDVMTTPENWALIDTEPELKRMN
jgi:hypothetical protein